MTSTVSKSGSLFKVAVFYFQLGWRRFADFDGRSTRAEFWIFWVANFVMIVALTLLDVSMGLFSVQLRMGAFSFLYSLAVIGPSWAVFIRRLHDSGLSGWWSLLALTPFVGSIAVLVLGCRKSQSWNNRYGCHAGQTPAQVENPQAVPND